jgi:predicted nuclease of predicted toxin-antitoxin system
VKVLLDENLDHSLRKYLRGHDVVTVSFMGWTGLRNGELLRAAEENGIEVLVTGDQTLHYEQNLIGRRVAIVVLSAIQLPIIAKNIASVIAAVGRSTPGSFQTVDCGTFTRKKAT